MERNKNETREIPGNRRPVAQTYNAMRREGPPHGPTLGETTKDAEYGQPEEWKRGRDVCGAEMAGHLPHGAVSVSADRSAGRATPEGGPRPAPRGLKTTTSEL